MSEVALGLERGSPRMRSPRTRSGRIDPGHPSGWVTPARRARDGVAPIRPGLDRGRPLGLLRGVHSLRPASGLGSRSRSNRGFGSPHAGSSPAGSHQPHDLKRGRPRPRARSTSNNVRGCDRLLREDRARNETTARSQHQPRFRERRQRRAKCTLNVCHKGGLRAQQ